MKLEKAIGEIYLASQSPARLEMLQKQGLTVHVCPQNCNEETTETEPGKVVQSLSALKLKSFMNSPQFKRECTAIACDTMLWFENRLIGKAHNEDEARNQISSLSGKTHQVYSGYAFYFKGKKYYGYDKADVTFSEISEAELSNYIASGEWKGAAGSYHIFGKAVDFIEKVKGDINTVIGLPLKKIQEIVNGVENE